MALNLPSVLTSLPPATRAVTALLVGFSSILFLLKLSSNPSNFKAIIGASKDSTLAFSYLVLVPGKALYFPWTVITAPFVEANLIEFLVSLFTLPLAGRYLERVWGQAEFIKFVVVVVGVSNCIAILVNSIESFVLKDVAHFMYGMSYHGLMALQIAFLVAFTQLIPEHQVQIFGGIAKIRVKSLPMLYVTLSNIACLLGYQSPYILIQFGWLTSWFYLRFVKFNEGGEFRGDRSETFAFKAWFPAFAQKYVGALSTFVFNLAVRFRILSPWTDIEMGGNTLGGSSLGRTGGRAEAERRREMALKALDQRMATSTKPGGSSTPVPTINTNKTRPSPAAGPSSVGSPKTGTSSNPMVKSASMNASGSGNGEESGKAKE